MNPSKENETFRVCPKESSSSNSLIPYDERLAATMIVSTKEHNNKMNMNMNQEDENPAIKYAAATGVATGAPAKILSKAKTEALEDKVVRNIGRTFAERVKNAAEQDESPVIDNSPEATASWLSKEALVQMLECDDLKAVLQAKLAKRIGVATEELDVQKVATKLKNPSARATDEYRCYVNFMAQRRQGKKVW